MKTETDMDFDEAQPDVDGLGNVSIADFNFKIKHAENQISVSIGFSEDGIIASQLFFIEEINGQTYMAACTIPDSIKVEAL